MLPPLAWRLWAASHLGAALGVDKDKHRLAARGQLVCRAGQAGRRADSSAYSNGTVTMRSSKQTESKQAGSKQADSK
jgi:hypothetical protein